MAMDCTTTTRLFLHAFLFTNSINSISTDNVTAAQEGSELQRTMECLQVYLVPVIIAVGIMGSSLGVFVLLGTHLRHKFFSHFLVCLNVTSAAFLGSVFISWLGDQAVEVFALPGLCQMYIFSSHFFPFITFWLIVLGSYLVLSDWVQPGAVAWLRNPAAAKTVVVALSALGFTVYSYKTWTHFSMAYRGSRVCTVIPENEKAMEILNIFDVVILLVLPSVLLLVFVLLVVFLRLLPRSPCDFMVRCRRTYGQEHVELRCACPSHSGEEGLPVMASSNVAARYREVHRLVLTQSVCFLLLVTPRAVSTWLVIVNRWVYHQKQSGDDFVINHMFQFSFYLFFALLPFCPPMTSRKFRRYCSDYFKGVNGNTVSSRLRGLNQVYIR